MRAPEFWRHDGFAAQLLTPLGHAYGCAVRARFASSSPAKAEVPVICVGNLVAGGAGKTPVALALARRLLARGRAPHFLTRGYGGRLAGPVRVDPAAHTARAVGDEALLLAAMAPAWVAHDRPAGARAAAAAGAQTIVMDDGHQNPSLGKDLAILVIDGGYGFGNRRVIPAGPLREPIGEGLARADAVVVVGVDECGIAREIGGRVPLLRARIAPTPGQDELADRDVVAFAGIGRPEKFFATLADLRCRIVAAHAYADHHAYAPDEIMRLADEAGAKRATLVTTAKDAVRLPPEARAMVRVLDVEIEWEDEAAVDALLDRAWARAGTAAAHG